MTHREQLAILALLIVLLLVFALVPRSAASDVPVAVGAVPQSEFVPVGGSQSSASDRDRNPGWWTTIAAPNQSRTPSPSARAVPSVAPVTGTASWFRSPRGVSAAGPALRTALGPGWRGTRVRVMGPAGSATTTLGDWCRCDTSAAPVVDLDAPIFRAVCGALSKGICRVEVTP